MSSTTLSNQKFYSMGLLDNVTLYYGFCDKANMANYVDFLRHSYEECGRIVIFAGNASIHKSKVLMGFSLTGWMAGSRCIISRRTRRNST